MYTNYYKLFLEKQESSTTSPITSSSPQQSPQQQNTNQNTSANPDTLGGLSKQKGTEARLEVKDISKNISNKYISDTGLKVGDTVNYISKQMREEAGNNPAQPKQAFILAMPGDKFKFKEGSIVDVNENEAVIIDPTSAEQWKAMRISNNQETAPQTDQSQQQPQQQIQSTTSVTPTQSNSTPTSSSPTTEKLDQIYLNHVLFVEQAFIKSPVKVSIISQGRVAGPDGQQKDQWVYTIGSKAGQEVPLEQIQGEQEGEKQTEIDEIQKGAEEVANEPPIDQNTKKQLESPNSTFDLDKKYYLNVTKAGGRTFDWKKLADKELRATFMSSKNITKAASDLEDYAAKLAPPQQESLFNHVFNSILNEATVQPSYTITGIGEVNGTALVQATVQAVLENVKDGADISKIQNKIRITDAAFNSLKEKVLKNIINISKYNMLIPNLLTLSQGVIKVNNTPLPDSSTALKPLQQGLLKGFKLPNVTNLKSFKAQFSKQIAPGILTQLKSVPEINAQITAFVKSGKKETDLHGFVTQSYGQLIESIIGQGAQKQVNIKAGQEIHNIVFELFCKPPENYILYLTDDEWNDIAKGGKVVGSILGVLTGIAKSF